MLDADFVELLSHVVRWLLANLLEFHDRIAELVVFALVATVDVRSEARWLQCHPALTTHNHREGIRLGAVTVERHVSLFQTHDRARCALLESFDWWCREWIVVGGVAVCFFIAC